MRIILESVDLINFNESNEATQAKARIVDYDQDGFEKYIEEYYPQGITESELNKEIIKYDNCFKKYFEFCKIKEEGDFDSV